MFLMKPITVFTESYSEQIDRLKHQIANADSIVVGAGAGLSTSAGFISRILQGNTAFRICIPAGFILTRHRKSIGHIGADIFTSTAMWIHPNPHIRICCAL